MVEVCVCGAFVSNVIQLHFNFACVILNFNVISNLAVVFLFLIHCSRNHIQSELRPRRHRLCAIYICTVYLYFHMENQSTATSIFLMVLV